MKKPLNFASVLVIAAALGAWAWQHAAPAERPAALFPHAAAAEATGLR